MPIYVGLEGTTPDSLILIHSSQSENDARTIADIKSAKDISVEDIEEAAQFRMRGY